MSPRAESFTEIVGQRPNVEAPGAVERQRHLVGVEVCDDETIHRHECRCRRAVNILIESDTGPTPIRPWSDSCRTLPCEVVAAAAADFLCGEQGRLLQKLTAKRVKRAIDHFDRRQWMLVPRADLCAIAVGRVGCEAETDDRFVGLVAGAQESSQPRRTADDERQHARRQRIERAGVPDPPLAQDAPHSRDDVVRRGTGRLVDDEQAVHRVYRTGESRRSSSSSRLFKSVQRACSAASACAASFSRICSCCCSVAN